MSYLRVHPWEQNHPLNGHPCPVTGLKPHVESEWIYTTDSYRLRTGVLERGVVLSLPVGHTTIQGTHRFFKNMQNIIHSPFVDRDNFVLLEDYSFHTGSDYEGRISYIKRMVEEVKPRAVIFYTNSFEWRFNIRLGVAIERWALTVRIADTYAHALQIAAEILGRPLESALPMNNPSSPLVWQSPKFEFHGEILDHGGILFSAVGILGRADVPEVIRIHGESLERSLATRSGSIRVIYDLSELTRFSMGVFFGVLKHWQGLSGNALIKQRIVVGTSFWARFVLKFFQLRDNKSVCTVRNISQAKKMLDVNYSENVGLIHEEDSSIGQALAILDGLLWEKPGLTLNTNESQDPDVRNFAYAIGSLKQDVDNFFAGREKEFVQLEEANNRAAQLSFEIEEALRLSEFEQLKVQKLAQENQSIANEIKQSLREILIVLADFVDIRSGAEPGFTRKLADMTHELGVACEIPQHLREDLYEAVLMHHVGFLGIPDTVSTDDPEYIDHCEVGYRVLMNTKGELMHYGAEIAYSHHERWDGTGYPRALVGEAIPLQARIVTIASEMLNCGIQNSSEMVTHLRSLAGTLLDPDLVELIAVNPFAGEHI